MHLGSSRWPFVGNTLDCVTFIKKNIHGPAPEYLKQLLPPLINQCTCTRYTLRGGDNFSIPHTRKSYIQNSFFWSALDGWNKLDLNIRESNTHTLFKTKLRQQLCKPPILSKLYNKISGKASVHHARMRIGLSGLNAHRRKYNFINDNTCPLCNMKAQNTYHYFLVCPVLATPRATLLTRVSQVLSNIPNQCFLIYSAIFVRAARLAT